MNAPALDTYLDAREAARRRALEERVAGLEEKLRCTFVRAREIIAARIALLPDDFPTDSATDPRYRLRELRTFACLSCDDLGDLIGKSGFTVWRIESGKIGQRKNAVAIEHLFGIPADHWGPTRY